MFRLSRVFSSKFMLERVYIAIIDYIAHMSQMYGTKYDILSRKKVRTHSVLDIFSQN